MVHREVRSQLWGVIAEYSIGATTNAGTYYDNLKKSKFWDKWRKNWYAEIELNKDNTGRFKNSEDQLLGVIAEYLVGDKDEALKMYSSIKENMWDKKTKQWKSSVTSTPSGPNMDYTSYDSIRQSRDQLVGILAEYILKGGKLNVNRSRQPREKSFFERVRDIFE